MAFTGFGPDITFLGVPRCKLADASTYADADIVILGAPLDGGTNYRSGTRYVDRFERRDGKWAIAERWMLRSTSAGGSSAS